MEVDMCMGNFIICCHIMKILTFKLLTKFQSRILKFNTIYENITNAVLKLTRLLNDGNNGLNAFLWKILLPAVL